MVNKEKEWWREVMLNDLETAHVLLRCYERWGTQKYLEVARERMDYAENIKNMYV